jgi:hypothetical protein
MANRGPNVVLPDGSRVNIKDLGTVKPTPKPKPKPKSTPTPTRETPAQYDARLRAALEAEKKAAAAKKKAGYK